MDGLCRNTEAGKLDFHFPHSAKLREVAGVKRTIAHSDGIPPENWRKIHIIAIIMALAAILLPISWERLARLLKRSALCGVQKLTRTLILVPVAPDRYVHAWHSGSRYLKFHLPEYRPHLKRNFS